MLTDEGGSVLAGGGGLDCSVSFSLVGSKVMPVALTSKGFVVGQAWGAVVGWEIGCATTRRAGG